jgi:hypothetical protein
MWFQVKRCLLFIRKDVLTEHVTMFQISIQKTHSSTHKVLLAHDEKRQIGMNFKLSLSKFSFICTTYIIFGRTFETMQHPEFVNGATGEPLNTKFTRRSTPLCMHFVLL